MYALMENINNMKNLKHILIAVIVIGLIAITFFSSQDKNKNEEFLYDLIDTMHVVYDLREESEDIFETAYSMNENLLNAKDNMTKWELDKDNIRKDTSKLVLEGVDTLITASDILIDLLETGEEMDSKMRLFASYIEKGRTEVMVGSFEISVLEGGIKLDTKEKERAIDYIDSLFGEELEGFSPEGENIGVQEVFAVGMIKTFLLK